MDTIDHSFVASYIQKRVSPAVAEVGKEIAVEVGKEVLKESLNIMKEQGEKAEKFVNKKVSSLFVIQSQLWLRLGDYIDMISKLVFDSISRAKDIK